LAFGRLIRADEEAAQRFPLIEPQDDAPSPQADQQIIEAVLIAEAHRAALQLLLARLRRGVIHAEHLPAFQIYDREALEQIVHDLDLKGQGHFRAAEPGAPLEEADAVFVQRHMDNGHRGHSASLL